MGRKDFLTSFKTEFNMGMQDFKRYDILLHQMDYWLVRARMRKENAIKEYWTYASTLWDNIWCFCNKMEREQMDAYFKDVEGMIDEGLTEDEINTLVKLLPQIHRRLHEIRKNHNLSVPWSISKSESKRASESLMMK